MDLKASGDLEQALIETLGDCPIVLATDAYKWSMAEAGFPLRRETFVLSFRSGGKVVLPCDLVIVAHGLIDKLIGHGGVHDQAFQHAVSHAGSRAGYSRTRGMAAATDPDVVGDAFETWAPPCGSWVLPGEPLLVVTGPSFAVSCLEAVLLMLNGPIQWATALELSKALDPYTPTCAEEQALIEQVGLAVGHKPSLHTPDPAAYQDRVRLAGMILKDLVGKRFFEVGLRAASCPAQHRLALDALRSVGLMATSHLWGAYRYDLTPVGTTGHEHLQRWGGDLAGFQALMDMRVDDPSFLFDTYDAVRLGIPAVVEAATIRGPWPFSVRFDSGDAIAQWLALRLKLGVRRDVKWIFEDGMDPDKIAAIERVRRSLDVPESTCVYGVGGFLISKPAMAPFDRDTVSAAYKLSETGGRPTMKWSASEGKQSLPGQPRIFRRLWGAAVPEPLRGTGSLVGQVGEHPPAGFTTIEFQEPGGFVAETTGHSSETTRLVAMCYERDIGRER